MKRPPCTLMVGVRFHALHCVSALCISMRCYSAQFVYAHAIPFQRNVHINKVNYS